MTKNYSFEDDNISADLYYYRLKQVDFDGTQNFSGIIALTKSSDKPFAVATVSPNPFINTLNLDFGKPFTGNLSIRLLSIEGKQLVAENRVLKNSSGFTINVDHHTVPSGIYFIQLVAGEEKRILKVVKE